jgi:hypothetical protein
VADLEHQDPDGSIVNPGDHAIVTHPVLPERAALGSAQGFAEAARIVQGAEALA